MLIPLGILAASGAAAGDYELISTAFGTGSNTEFIFSSIPSTYKHLQIRYSLQTTGTSAFLRMQFNSVTSNSYAVHELSGQGSTTFSQNGINQTNMYIRGLPTDSVSNNHSGGVVDILDYSSSTKNTTHRTLSGNYQTVSLGSGFINNTSAISSIRFFPNDGAFTSASRISLYGIKG
jgi:hypothetical protein